MTLKIKMLMRVKKNAATEVRTTYPLSQDHAVDYYIFLVKYVFKTL